MIHLQIGNSFSKITGISPKQEAELRKALSYKVTNPRDFRQTTRYLIDRRGSFPSGLLERVLKSLEGTEYQVEDTRAVPKPTPGMFKLSLPFSPYKAQTNAVDSFVSHGNGIVVAPTGSGKSVICALLINKMQTKTLIVVPTLELKKQLTNSLSSFFGQLDNITVANVDSIDPDSISDVGLLIIDEYHSSAAKTYQKLNRTAWKNIYHRAGLTATPYRNNDAEQIVLECIVSKVISRLEYTDAVDQGYVVPVQFFYIELPKTNVSDGAYHQIKSKLVIKNKTRNNRIAELVSSLEAAGESTLVLVHEIEHAQEIQKELQHMGIEVPIASGENPNNRILLLEFNLKERKTLIATSVLGVGVDTKPCTFVILAATGKSRPQLVQNVGRCMRTSPGKTVGTVILFRDKSHEWLNNHFNVTTKSIKEEYGQIPIKI